MRSDKSGADVRGAVTVEVRRRPDAAEERIELLAGLHALPRTIPSKHFYDARGLALFDAITELDEYYPTRTERGILVRVAPEVAAVTAAAQVIELGSGSATKTRLLLDALAAHGTLAQYVPVDVNEESLARVGAELTDELPGLAVHGIAADFLGALAPLPAPPSARSAGAPSGSQSSAWSAGAPSGSQPSARSAGAASAGPPGARLVLFLGGTLGNLRPGDEAPQFLTRLRAALRPGDWFLLGVDLVKDIATLEAAYDDARGVTAEFDRNILRVVNRLLDADFSPQRFRHRAFYDAVHDWIEMRLVADEAHAVHLGATGETLAIARGEEIRTEISAKYTRARAESLLAATGFEPEQWHSDERGWFGVALARAR